MQTITEEHLSIKHLFDTDKYEEIPQRRLQRQHDAEIFPNRVFQSVDGSPKVSILMCYQSHGGSDYGINTDGLRYLQSEPADKKYVLLVSSDDKKNKTVDYFDAVIELGLLLKSLEGVTPMAGRWGKAKFFWINKEGNSSDRHKM